MVSERFNNMKVLIISRGFPDEIDPIYGNFESDQAHALSEIGHEVVVMCVDRRFHVSKRRKLGISCYSDGNVKVYKIFLFPLPINICIRLFNVISVVLGKVLYHRIVKDWGVPDIIHSHYLFTLPLALSISRKCNIPLVATEHWSRMSDEGINKSIKRVASRCYPNVDALISVSCGLQNFIKSSFGVDSYVVNNIVDTRHYNFRALKNAEGTFNFVSIGNLIDRKGFDLLLYAFSKVNSDKLLNLYIIGDGPDKDDLMNLSVELGISDKVFFMGKRERHEIAAIFDTCHVFVLPSRSETFGVVYIEAMANGLPVIATRCGGPETFITPQDGLLVDVDDEEGLKMSIEEIINSYKTYDPYDISLRCMAKFSSEVIGKQIHDIYKQLVKK